MATAVKPTRLSEPVRYRSSGKWYTPQTYIVGWPEGIVKVGSTANGRQRWGTFLSRGAVMLDIGYFDGIDDVHAELWIQAQLDEMYPRAFHCKEDSKPYLGTGGCGYLECYSIPQSEWASVVQIARA